jgi:hypothetical protein
MSKVKQEVLMHLQEALKRMKHLKVEETGLDLWDDEHDDLRHELGDLLCKAAAIIQIDIK